LVLKYLGREEEEAAKCGAIPEANNCFLLKMVLETHRQTFRVSFTKKVPPPGTTVIFRGAFNMDIIRPDKGEREKFKSIRTSRVSPAET
jgi:hypothetical protein